eukprot:gnl/TRDRNA2_/TRDRNA2_180506_c0_seq1.p1 gnl/TRDRNA2_/TRDRNA2_180506_c0~~gnl/TRDRNA2_/TRDRNA2_180506_c0_seq1.p1  ORF type:complete len:556 (-),score=178.71 gnl/TRDRNA2_/TRDRNA2_180506_c0_seq1:73-1740(-)
MPYLEDGETWSWDAGAYEEGMAENQPGHKKLNEYALPRWVKHPLTHPSNGIVVGPKEYMYCAGDGFCNTMGWSIAHVAAKFGNVDLLEMCTEDELNQGDVEGKTPAMYAVMYGNPWLLQALVEKGADIAKEDHAGYSPEDTIWRNARLHNVEMEWMFSAVKGELTEKQSLKAQEYKIVKNRYSGNDPIVTEKLDKDMKKMRKFWYGLGDYQKEYQEPSQEEILFRDDLPSSKVLPLEKKKPSVPSALLFPGQGSQYVGMMKDVVDRPAVREMLAKAKDILGWDPKDLALNGPEEKLSETKFCQPLMFIAGLAAMDLMKEKKPDDAERPQAVAGLSLGEYTALAAAGVLSFEDGLRLVKLRGEAMQKATDLVPQSMCSVAGLERAKVDKICQEAVKLDTTAKVPYAQVANLLFPAGFTVGGTKMAIDQVCKLAMAQKALQARVIKAGGAFHTPLMQPAADELGKAIDSLRGKMSPPKCAIYFNFTGKKISAGADPNTFVDLLKKQLTNEVQWEPTIKAMIMDGVKDFFEVGPLKQIKSMIKRIDADAFKRTENMSV